MHRAYQVFEHEILRLARSDGYSVSQKKTLLADSHTLFIANEKNQTAISIHGIEAALQSDESALNLARKRYHDVTRRFD